MRLIIKLSLILAVIVLQTGCFSKSITNDNSIDSHNEDELIVYLNDFDEIIAPMFEEATGHQIKLVQGSGAEIMSRIEAERGNPHWDIVWLDLISSIHDLGVKGLLYEDYTPKNAANLKDTFTALIPEEKWYYPTGAHASSVIVYNHDELTEEQAPASWSDFANPALHGTIGFADPAIAAPAYSFVNWFFNEHGMIEGKDMMNSWFNNGLKIYPKNPNVAMALMSGQIKVAALQESNAHNLINQNTSFSIVWPKDGAPASVRVAAISKDTKKLEVARAFIDFLLDPATQQAIIDNSMEAYHEPSAIGVMPKTDRELNAKLLYANTTWSQQHEAEIKQWFADYSIE